MSISKTSNNNNNGSSSSSTPAPIEALPRDLLVKIIAKVASDSVADLRNVKMCCKHFLDAAEDECVWQQVSLDKFPLFPLNPKALSFLKRCKESGNIESVYREGLEEYFSYPKGNISGLGHLKLAAQKGHTEAKYVYGNGMLVRNHTSLCPSNNTCKGWRLKKGVWMGS
ncbi:putative F-box protein, partial [Mucuna pruriens]